jgi:hypothetical protein
LLYGTIYPEQYFGLAGPACAQAAPRDIPTKTNTYAWKYLTRRSLVLYSHVARRPEIGGAPAGIAVSALQYGIPKNEQRRA